MSFRNKVGSNIEAAKLEIKSTIEMKLDKIKAEKLIIIDYLDTKISAITSNKHSSYYDQPSADIIK